MNDAERALRGEIIRTCLAMEARGINQGTSGNVSARWGEGILITPSGLGYATMAPEDVIFLEMDGTAHGPHNPSTEWRFHLDIMRERPDVSAIVHAHPPHLTGLSMLNKDIPAVHYMIAAVGGPSIRCAPYATYGTEELSRNAIAALEGRMGCILSNHGVISCGPTLAKALWLAVEMETLAQQYVIALSAGTPVVLSDDEIANVIEKFKSYGPRRKDEGKLAAPAAKIEAPAPAPEKAAAPAPAAKSAPAKTPPAKPARPEPSKPAAKAAPKRAAARKSAAAPTTASAKAPASKPAPKASARKAAANAPAAEAPAPAAPEAAAPAPAKSAPAKTAPTKSARARKAPAATPAAPKGPTRKAASASGTTSTTTGSEKAADAAPATGSEPASKAARKKPVARRPRAAKNAS